MLTNEQFKQENSRRIEAMKDREGMHDMIHVIKKRVGSPTTGVFKATEIISWVLKTR